MSAVGFSGFGSSDKSNSLGSHKITTFSFASLSHRDPNVNDVINMSSEVDKYNFITINFDKFTIKLSNQVVFSSRMSLYEYVKYYEKSYFVGKHRKNVPYNHEEFIYMETGPHIYLKPKEFFMVDRTDYVDFQELKNSPFSSDICMYDDHIIIKKFNIFYHFNMIIEDTNKSTNYTIGSLKRQMSAEDKQE